MVGYCGLPGSLDISENTADVPNLRAIRRAQDGAPASVEMTVSGLGLGGGLGRRGSRG